MLGVLAATGRDAVAVDGSKFYRVAQIDGAGWFVAPDGSKLFSSGVNVVDVGGTRDSYRAERPEYAAFRHYPDDAAWSKKTQERLAAWGFNTIGGWSARDMTTGP